jgi:3-mercaptopyruvate sulfurtransferase SseA
VYDGRNIKKRKEIINPKEGDKGFLRGHIPVTYHLGWGWLTEKKYFKLRQSEPRMGP